MGVRFSSTRGRRRGSVMRTSTCGSGNDDDDDDVGAPEVGYEVRNDAERRAGSMTDALTNRGGDVNDDERAPERCVDGESRACGETTAGMDGREGAVRWTTRLDESTRTFVASSRTFVARVDKRGGTRAAWKLNAVVRKGVVSVFLERCEMDGDVEALMCAFSVSLVISNETRFETYFGAKRFAKAGDTWGVLEMFEVFARDDNAEEFTFELTFHEISPTYSDGDCKPTLPSMIQCVSDAPCMFVLDDFLTPSECRHLINLAEREGLKRSRVTDGKLSDGRTSSSTFLTGASASDAVVRRVERRIMSVLRSPIIAEKRSINLDAHEPLQVVRYDAGQYYTAHFDNRASNLSRSVTAMVYLMQPESGGATCFPKARHRASIDMGDSDSRRPGVRVHPKPGRAVIFWNVRDGKEDSRSIHCGEKVTAGEKYIATQWLTYTASE